MKPHKLSRLSGALLAVALAASSLSLVAQTDVTQPSDPLIASSDNAPGSEGVANAIDNADTKYLNFDAADGTDVGFVVTPSVGLTWVTGMTLKSANDAPERDPKQVRLEGSNDESVTDFASGNWELIYENLDIPAFAERFETQSFSFPNLMPYLHYRWTVLEVADVTAANSMQIAEVELVGKVVPADVTQPSDALIASSDNAPGSEGVANAIDNADTKYLNFDAADGTDVGFIVTPQVGATLVTGLSMKSANDAPERDPAQVRLEGSNDDSFAGFDTGNWTLIYENLAVPAYVDRFENQTFLFENYIPYKHYRWTVLEVADVTAANSMQIAEVELHGTGAPVDVTQPSDALIASSDNAPGSEGVANAIDNADTKYLNFDAADGTDVGFIVTPQVGDSTIIGMTLKSANDAPERDPAQVIIEGSNDETVTDFLSGNWELIYENLAIPAFGERFQIQEFYFPNTKSFKHYRWTVLEVADVTAANSMQIAEVELLAVTDQADCEKARILRNPEDAPVLSGQSALFKVQINGPYPVQWFADGAAIPGATKTSYLTDPITAANTDVQYHVEIVGCQASPTVQAILFTPDTVKSIGLNWIGGGANGAPTSVDPEDIAGVHFQAYWNNMTNASEAIPVTVLDSDNQQSTVTVSFASSGTWGAGTAGSGDNTPTQKFLNGLIYDNPGGDPGSLTFNNVPAGSHSVLLYTVGIPDQFQDQDYTVIGAATESVYTLQQNSGQYKANPTWARGSSPDPDVRTLANYVRFDQIAPAADGTIRIEWTTATEGFDRGVAINAAQLLVDPPYLGEPPTLVQGPQPTETLDGGTVELSVLATGDDLTYQWLKDGVSLTDGGNISGATGTQLTITRFSSADEGFYSVEVANTAGTSPTAAVKVKVVDANRTMTDTLVSYLKYDETAGATAANSGSDNIAGEIRSGFGFGWVQGVIGNAYNNGAFGDSYTYVSDYTKTTEELTVAFWVYATEDNVFNAADVSLIRNAEGALNPADGEQFEVALVYNDADLSLRLSATIAAGPNRATASEAVPFPLGSWEHVAFTADGGQVRLYHNGILVATTGYSGTINIAQIPYLTMGARGTDDGAGSLIPDQILEGSLDDVGIWTAAWTGDVIQSIYAQGMAGQDLTTASVPDLPEVPSDVTLSTETLPGGGVRISFAPADGVLEATGDVADPAGWTEVPGNPNPYDIATPAEGGEYFRVRIGKSLKR